MEITKEIPALVLEEDHRKLAEPKLPRLRRDFTVAELRQYDGNQPGGRVLVAINGFVFDVTRDKHFYGPDGLLEVFAGHDASRNVAKADVTVNDNDEFDDLSDLNAMEMCIVRGWEKQFRRDYILVGKLLRKGEQHADYVEEAEEEGEDEEEEEEEEEEEDNAYDAKAAEKNNNTKDERVGKRFAADADGGCSNSTD